MVFPAFLYVPFIYFRLRACPVNPGLFRFFFNVFFQYKFFWFSPSTLSYWVLNFVAFIIFIFMSLSSSYIFYLKFFLIVFKISFFKKNFVILSHVNQATRLDLNYHDLNIVFFCVANCVALEYETAIFGA
jgi:hypothetical protein